MLSFDFTDFNVKIVKGSLSRGKIIINKAVSVNLPDGVIINGVIQEINKVVIIINDALKRNNIHDRDAVISISSSQIVFKDLVIPSVITSYSIHYTKLYESGVSAGLSSGK